MDEYLCYLGLTCMPFMSCICPTSLFIQGIPSCHSAFIIHPSWRHSSTMSVLWHCGSLVIPSIMVLLDQVLVLGRPGPALRWWWWTSVVHPLLPLCFSLSKASLQKLGLGRQKGSVNKREISENSLGGGTKQSCRKWSRS